MSPLKTFFALIAITLLLAIIYLIVNVGLKTSPKINNFSDCLQAGYPIMESFPRQCQTPSGKNFTEDISTIKSYAECVALGYPILKSLPPQCQTPDGRLFTEEKTGLNKTDLIKITQPIEKSLITSPLTVRGEARGQWYFEATFPLVIKDANGKELGRSYAEAVGDWMTAEFVPFAGKIEFKNPTTATGFLILEKSNPSGLVEKMDQLTIPISFEKEITATSTQDRAKDGCIITGCSNQICSDDETVSTCEYNETYACYSEAICGRNQTGQCEWQETEALKQCLLGPTPYLERDPA